MRKHRTRNLATSVFGAQAVENLNIKDDEQVFNDEQLDWKIERECVRVRLLQLLDLQFVEGFVCSPSAGSASPPGKNRNPPSDLRHFHSIFQSSTDPWLKRAIDVFSHIPEAETHLNNIKHFSPNRKKILLFEGICNHYNRMQGPFISSQWEEVITAIQNVISKYNVFIYFRFELLIQ
jgi:hypothetical protein